MAEVSPLLQILIGIMFIAMVYALWLLIFHGRDK